MKPASLAGLVLIVLGVITFAYQGITYTTHKKVLNLQREISLAMGEV